MQSLRIGEIKLNSVTWTAKLPHVSFERESPDFVLNGAAVKLTIISTPIMIYNNADPGMVPRKQYWHISLRQIPGQSNIEWKDRGILSYLRKKDGDFVLFTWNSQYGSGQVDSAQLSANGLTADDEMCMLFVFDTRSELSKCSTDVSKETELPTTDKPSIQTLCLQELSENIEKMFDKSENSDAVVEVFTSTRTF